MKLSIRNIEMLLGAILVIALLCALAFWLQVVQNGRDAHDALVQSQRNHKVGTANYADLEFIKTRLVVVEGNQKYLLCLLTHSPVACPAPTVAPYP